MPKTVSQIVLVILIVSIAAYCLAGCGSSKSSFSQSVYVESLLDACYKAEFDEYTKMTGSSPEEALALYESNLAVIVDDICGALSFEVPTENRERLAAALGAMFKSASYEVQDAKKVTDDEYTVELKIQPINNFNALWADITVFTEDFITRIDNSEFDDMERREIYAAFAEGLTGIVEKGVQTIEYGPETAITVSVRRGEHSRWFVPDTDCDSIFRQIIAM